MPAPSHTSCRFPAWPALLIGLCVISIFAAPPLAWWQMNRNPVVHIPTPKLPVPNAFDYYVKAAKMLPYPIPYIDPKALATVTPQQRTSFPALRPEVMRVISDGTQFRYLAPPIRSEHDLMPYLAKYRNMARYFDVLALLSAEKGDWAAAMGDSLVSMRLGEEVKQGSCEIGALVGDACGAIGRKQAWRDIDHLSPQEARRGLLAMEVIDAREVPFSQTMQEEKYTVEAFILELFRSPNWREKCIQENYADEKYEMKSMLRLRLAFVNKRRSLARFAAWCDTCIEMAKGPFSRRTPGGPPYPDDIICQTSLPVFEKAWLKTLIDSTANRLLTVQLALQAYHGEHGDYPATLPELVTAGYLHTLPDDPFALAGTFRYMRKGNGYLLYSLGPDGTDDGGKPIMDTKVPTKPTSSPMVGSKGDIVAGVNRL